MFRFRPMSLTLSPALIDLADRNGIDLHGKSEAQLVASLPAIIRALQSELHEAGQCVAIVQNSAFQIRKGKRNDSA